MKMSFLVVLIGLIMCNNAFTQNPIILNQFSADPSARVFNKKVYLFPSHDISAKEGQGRPGWFCMEDYHVFSSENLIEWEDYGVIVSQYSASWVDSNSYSMWAPDCIERNGKYYFYFPANMKNEGDNKRREFGIGVAIAEQPQGPYVPQSHPIEGIFGIDPNVLIDKDGQAYIYWSMGNIYVAKLKENMIELDSEPMVIANLPNKGLKEGPFVFERNGIYYLTFPHVENKTERLEYAIGDSPLGPFEMMGVVMDESPMNCWTNHHSIINYEDQWYLFYHQNALSPKFDKNRSVCVDSLFFKDGGKIEKVLPTLRGVGVSKANLKIQLDRYSDVCENGVEIQFIDTLNTFKGWKVVYNEEKAWVKYNAVDFGKGKSKRAIVKAKSINGGSIQLFLDSKEGAFIGEIEIGKGNDWGTFEVRLSNKVKGVHDIIVTLSNENIVEVDWVKFK